MRSPAIKTVAPPGPFRHLQVDYITLPKCEGKQDVLVIVDKFSRWIECYPTSKGTAAHTAKMLVQDFIPRWGLPEQIESDQGTHFTGQVVQAICKLLKVNWKLHCPYRPQASGQVERVNRVIKERLTKLHSQGVKWTAALPAVLCSIRATSNKTVGLSPYEVVTGQHNGILLADRGYPCMPYVMTPCPDPEPGPQSCYNVALCRTRARVEMTIRILKARFQCLWGLRVTPERA
ncbi:hypothetical protein SRHO_G00038480 [Serrasalmus rhombeus]